MDDIYVINDLESYANILRNDAADTLNPIGDQTQLNTNDLNDFITINQIYSLIDGYALGQDDEGQYLIDAECHDHIIEDIRNWIFNVGLAKLASQGYIECAWDSDINEMVFWLPSSTTTKTNSMNHESRPTKTKGSKRKNS